MVAVVGSADFYLTLRDLPYFNPQPSPCTPVLETVHVAVFRGTDICVFAVVGNADVFISPIRWSVFGNHFVYAPT